MSQSDLRRLVLDLKVGLSTQGRNCHSVCIDQPSICNFQQYDGGQVSFLETLLTAMLIVVQSPSTYGPWQQSGTSSCHRYNLGRPKLQLQTGSILLKCCLPFISFLPCCRCLGSCVHCAAGLLRRTPGPLQLLSPSRCLTFSYGLSLDASSLLRKVLALAAVAAVAAGASSAGTAMYSLLCALRWSGQAYWTASPR